MKLCSIGYVPPPSFNAGIASVFLANLRKFRLSHDLVLYSEHPWPDCERLKANPEMVKKGLKPDQFGQLSKWAVNNAIFLTGMKIAALKGYTHIIYLESDCRVGCDNWDGRIFEEHFNGPLPWVASGSLVCWNPMAGGMESAQRWNDLLVSTNERRNFPIPTYGHGASAKDKVSVFPNGALGVYDMRWIKKFFPERMNLMELSTMHAWDFVLGEKIWNVFGPDSYDMVGNLRSVFSSYADQITTENERLNLLRDGKVCAVHQVKSLATI